MKRLLTVLLSFILLTSVLKAQDQQEIVSKCALSIGENTTFLKDYVIKLPEISNPANIPVYKANFYLLKKQNYRFTMCNSEESNGELILELHDKEKLISSSVLNDKIYNSFDFSCNKTGLYTLWYSFNEGKKGMGVGIVSLIK